jgi:hypothetical protein
MSESRRPFTDLIPKVHRHLRAVPPVLILEAAVEIAREFCRDTTCWTMDLDPIYVRSGQSDYELEVDACQAEIVGVTESYVSNQKQVEGTDYTLMDRTLYHFLSEPGVSISQGLQVTVALRPTEDATQIDERVYNDYYEAFRDGIIWRLASEKNKPWSDPALASERLILFENAKEKARVDVIRGGPGMKANLQMKPLRSWL